MSNEWNEMIDLSANGQEETFDQNWFEEQLAEYDYHPPRRGQLLEGEVSHINGDTIFVDVGMKREAVVPPREVDELDESHFKDLSVGDRVTVYVTQTPVGNRDLTVSLLKGQEMQDWERVESMVGSDETLDLKVVGENRGGLLVQFGALQGFVPNSQIPGLRRVHDRDRMRDIKSEMMGMSVPVKVIEVDRVRNRLIFSAREAEAELRQQRLQELQAGTKLMGRVVKIVDFGAFVDLGGVDGLVHVSELDWSRVDHPSDVLEPGQELEVLVKEVDVDRERISLSRKDCLPNPWEEMKEKYEPGTVVKGKITDVMDFGAFVELPEGVVGLVHASEIGYNATGNPDDVVRQGETILVKILSVDPERERIALSMRRVPVDQQISWVVE